MSQLHADRWLFSTLWKDPSLEKTLQPKQRLKLQRFKDCWAITVSKLAHPNLLNRENERFLLKYGKVAPFLSIVIKIYKMQMGSSIFVNKIYVLLRLRVQNRRTKWNFPLNFRTMRKLSELYSRIFQTQLSGWVSGLDHFRNFTNLKILNI